MRLWPSHNPSQSGSAAQAGFTLVELLVALTLLAMLSVMLFGGLRFGARSWDAVADRSERADRVAASQAFLRRQLSQASPEAGAEGASDEAAGLRGAPDSLAFTAPWLSSISLGGLYRFELVHGGGEDGALILSWSPLQAEAEGLDSAPDLAGSRALLEGVSGLELSYYGADDPLSEAVWREDWPADGPPPRLVKVAVSFADGRQVWPPLIVSLKN